MAARLSLSQTLANDPQMAIPRHPRVPEDLLLLWDSLNSLIVFGAGSPVVFGGKAAAALLPPLLPLMKGVLSTEEIVERLAPVPAAQVHKAISLMYLRGMIEDGVAREAPVASPAPLRQFYSRYLDLTRVFRNRDDLLRHLQRSRVLAIGDAIELPPIVAGLAGLGLGHVTLHAPAALRAATAAAATDLELAGNDVEPDAFLQTAKAEDFDGYDLIVLLTAEERPELAARLNALTRGNRTRIACGVLGHGLVRLGPVMQKPYSACVECAALTPAASGPFDALARELAVQHFTLAYFALLTQFAPITSIDYVQELCPDTLQFRRIPLYKQPRCRACGDGRGEADLPAGAVVTGRRLAHPLAWFYNENTNFKQYHMVPKGHQAHYDDKNKRAVNGALKKIENASTAPLPQSAGLPESLQQPYAGRMHLAPSQIHGGDETCRVAMLLSLCAGRRVQSVTEDWNVGFRATPSAGAMASQNLYLINFGLHGIAAGAHYFSPNGHLEQITAALPDLSAQGLLRPAGAGADALAAIVVTEAYARIESKYVGISYRYTLSDAGAMLATLKAAAVALQLRLATCANFLDDGLAAYLGCKAVSEYPALIAFVLAPDEAAPC